MFGFLQEAEKIIGEATDEILAEGDDGQEARAKSGEIYGVLCLCFTGEAMTVCKGTPDCNGLMAWQWLHRRCNPRRMARVIWLMTQVANPQRAKHLREVDAAPNALEDRIRQVDREFDERLPSIDNDEHGGDHLMLPTVVHNFVYQHVDEKTVAKVILDHIRSWVGNKVTISEGPVPMDVGEVVEDWGVEF